MFFFAKLISRNVLRQKLRTALTALGIMVAIMSFGLLRTLVDAWYAGVDSASSSRLVTRNAISLIVSLPISYANRIRLVDGVTGVSYASWFGGVYIDEKNFFPQFAVEGPHYFRLFPEILLAQDALTAFQRDRKGVIVGRKLMERFGWKLGDVVPLRGTIYAGTWSFVIRGVYHGATRSVDETQFFFHWAYLNEELKKTEPNRADHAEIFFVGIDRPDRVAEVSNNIDRLFKNSLAETLTETEKAFQLGFVAMTEAILIAIQIVSFVVIGIIMAVMSNTMAMSARERTREFATLRALGFRPSRIALLIFGESVTIAVVAGLAGILATFPAVDLIARTLSNYFPVFVLSETTQLMSVVAAVIVGIVAAIFPTWKAVREPVVEGLRSVG